MRKIPPEIDQLMWSIAEAANPQAIDEFGARFPEFRSELLKRMGMLRGLRDQRPGLTHSKPIPVFRPQVPTRQAPSGGIIAVGAVFTVITVAALAYTLSASRAQSRQALKPPVPVNLAPIRAEEPVRSNSLPAPQVENQPPVQIPKMNEGLPSSGSEPSRHGAVALWEKPLTVKIRKASLLDVIKVVSSQGGLQLVIGDGMPNPEIEVDYDGMNAADILKDLGKTYHFTPMLNDDDSVYLIPAVDPKQEEASGSESRSINTRKLVP